MVTGGRCGLPVGEVAGFFAVAVAREGDGPASDSMDGRFRCSSCVATLSFDWLAEDEEEGGDGSLDAPPVTDACSLGACQLEGFVLRRR
jgi:hypothetical protein